MKKINLVFDEEYDDAAIIFVQDEFCKDIDCYMSEFDAWVHDKSNGCFQMINNQEICSVDTDEFVRWLNLKFGSFEKDQARVITQNTIYNPSLPVAEL